MFLMLMLLTSVLKAETTDNVRKAYKGIIIVEGDSTIRAMEPYSLSPTGIQDYADVVNEYQQQFPKLHIYCMPIPNAIAFYCPDSVSNWTSDEHRAISQLLGKLNKQITGIDLVPVLAPHTEEPIYLRTDHHWAPLGAYYAAQEFAQVAYLEFLPLDTYKADTIHNFVGTMQKFSRDEAIGKYPEDFVYYIPQQVDYSSTHVRYYNKKVRVRRRRYTTILQAHPAETCDFFRKYPDGSAAAYSTFMGGDLNTTSVYTSVANGRHLLVLKDSYGNALPAYLFGSFEEIHVVDCRYFLDNIGTFIKEHAITDLLFANNLIHASSPKTSQSYQKYLTQKKK